MRKKLGVLRIALQIYIIPTTTIIMSGLNEISVLSKSIMQDWLILKHCSDEKGNITKILVLF